jgi:hypothetical protein
LTTPPDRTPQGVTTPRYLRQTAGGVIETSPLGSAFTYGYLAGRTKILSALPKLLHKTNGQGKILTHLFYIAFGSLFLSATRGAQLASAQPVTIR